MSIEESVNGERCTEGEGIREIESAEKMIEVREGRDKYFKVHS